MGKFVFYYSVVGARKSAELILTAHRNMMAGKKVAVFQPATAFFPRYTISVSTPF